MLAEALALVFPLWDDLLDQPTRLSGWLAISS
jgi:hypothetical protein